MSVADTYALESRVDAVEAMEWPRDAEDTALDEAEATLDLLCVDGMCPGVIPGTEAVRGFWDSNHLNDAGSLYLGGHLSCFLEEQGL